MTTECSQCGSKWSTSERLYDDECPSLCDDCATTKILESARVRRLRDEPCEPLEEFLNNPEDEDVEPEVVEDDSEDDTTETAIARVEPQTLPVLKQPTIHGRGVFSPESLPAADLNSLLSGKYKSYNYTGGIKLRIPEGAALIRCARCRTLWLLRDDIEGVTSIALDDCPACFEDPDKIAELMREGRFVEAREALDRLAKQKGST